MDNSFLCFSISWTCSGERGNDETEPEAGGARHGAEPAVVRVCGTGQEYKCAEQFTRPLPRLFQRALVEAVV